MYAFIHRCWNVQLLLQLRPGLLDELQLPEPNLQHRLGFERELIQPRHRRDDQHALGRWPTCRSCKRECEWIPEHPYCLEQVLIERISVLVRIRIEIKVGMIYVF